MESACADLARVCESKGFWIPDGDQRLLNAAAGVRAHEGGGLVGEVFGQRVVRARISGRESVREPENVDILKFGSCQAYPPLARVDGASPADMHYDDGPGHYIFASQKNVDTISAALAITSVAAS